MSSDFDVISRAYAAWNQDDLSVWLETLHPDFEWRTSGVFPDLDPVYRGYEGATEFWRAMHEPWERFRVDVDQVEPHDDWFLVTIRFRAKGVDSGAEADMRFANAIRVREGLAIEIVPRRTVEEARDLIRQRQAATSRQ